MSGDPLFPPVVPADLGPAPTDPFRLSKHLIQHHGDQFAEEAVDRAEADTLRRWHTNAHSWGQNHIHPD